MVQIFLPALSMSPQERPTILLELFVCIIKTNITWWSHNRLVKIVISYQTHNWLSSLWPPATILSETLSSSKRFIRRMKWNEFIMRDRSFDSIGSFPKNSSSTLFRASICWSNMFQNNDLKIDNFIRLTKSYQLWGKFFCCYDIINTNTNLSIVACPLACDNPPCSNLKIVTIRSTE